MERGENCKKNISKACPVERNNEKKCGKKKNDNDNKKFVKAKNTAKKEEKRKEINLKKWKNAYCYENI